MSTTSGSKRQLIELLKIYVICVVPWILMAVNSVFSSNGVPGLIIAALLVPFSTLYGLIAYYPVALIWLIWLSIAHFKAVQVKYDLAGPPSKSKVIALLLNRPFILLAGLPIFSPLVLLESPYGMIFAAYVEAGYLAYFLISKIPQLKANA